MWFLATELVPGEQRLEGTEAINVRRLPLHEALDMALNGQITDALSQVAIMSYALSRTSDV